MVITFVINLYLTSEEKPQQAGKQREIPSEKQQLIASVHHSYPERNSLEIVTNNLEVERNLSKKIILFHHIKNGGTTIIL